MYERFSDRALKIAQLANQQAQSFNHEYIGTEHILLGLVKEGTGVAANVLQNLEVDLRKVRLEVEQIIQSGPDMVTMGKLPLTPRSKKVLEYAMEESVKFGHNYIGSEHLLLGLIREREGVAAQVLMNLGVTFSDVRKEIAELLGMTLTKDDHQEVPHSGFSTFVDLEKVEFTDRARNVMLTAQAAASKLGADVVDVEHLLLGILEERGEVLIQLLEEFGIEREFFTEALRQKLKTTNSDE
jgi:ATP-dependent Clp protease ATP-binding subunit ClpA